MNQQRQTDNHWKLQIRTVENENTLQSVLISNGIPQRKKKRIYGNTPPIAHKWRHRFTKGNSQRNARNQIHISVHTVVAVRQTQSCTMNTIQLR